MLGDFTVKHTDGCQIHQYYKNVVCSNSQLLSNGRTPNSWSTSCRLKISGVASTGARGDRVSPVMVKNLPKRKKKEEKIRKIQEKRGQIKKNWRKRKNWQEIAKLGKVFFTLPLLTDTAGYATAQTPQFFRQNTSLKFHKFWSSHSCLSVSKEISGTTKYVCRSWDEHQQARW